MRYAAAWLAWALWTLNLALWMLFVFVWGLRGFEPLPGSVPPNGGYWQFLRATQAVAFVAAATIGALVAAKHPRNPIGWLICAVSTCAAVEFPVLEYGALATHSYGPHAQPPFVVPIAWAAIWPSALGAALDVPLLLLFPSGRLPSARWRLLLGVSLVLALALGIAAALRPGPLAHAPGFGNPFGVPEAAGALATVRLATITWGLPLASLLAALSLGVRLQRARGEQRQQLKWVAYAAVLYWLLVALTSLTPAEWSPALSVAYVLAHGGFVLSLGLAVLKYRLYEIDLVIHKTLVYGALAACVTAAYVVIVVGVGVLVGARGEPNLWLSLLATAAVAVAFEPLRERVQLLANRLVYGHRASPYEVLADFSNRMAGALSVDAVLPRMAEAAARGLGASRVRVRVFVAGGRDRAVAWPPEALDAAYEQVVPVLHRRELVGEIAMSKPPGETLQPAEAKLLRDLAAQAGPALDNVRLAHALADRAELLAQQAAELQASRQRLVAAQDAERRRLERDIHDGAQQHLVALAVHLRLLKAQLLKDPARAAAAVDDLVQLANTALAELRDMARGVFPPLLADRGLVAALQGHLTKAFPAARLEVDSAVADTRLAAHSEAAVYFCVREALQNTAKHAPGALVVVRLALEADHLAFTVQDAGPGFALEASAGGSGLQGMRDRLAAIGGTLEIDTAPGQGMRVTGRVPVQDAAVTAQESAESVAAAQAAASVSGPNSALGR